VASDAEATDVSIADHGAVGDGKRLNTVEIQTAIDAVSKKGGGRVVVPAGIFRSGAVWLKAGVELHLDPEAVLAGSSDIDDFPTCQTRIEGKVQPWRPALVNAVDLDGVAVTGAGTLDGFGKPYWAAFWKRRAENPKCTNLEVERPRLMYFENCRDVTVSGVRLKDSGFWNLHVYRCNDVTLDGLSITAPHGDPPKIIGDAQPWDEMSIDRAPSSDGIDVDSCQNVIIRRCVISVGDDCIALKGTKGPHALEDRSSPPVENVVVEDCDFLSGHGMLTCGSEATVIRNVTVRRCRVGRAIPVVRLKLRPDTPQTYENLRFEDLMLEDAQALFDVKPWTQFFDLQGAEPPPSIVRNVSLRRISGTVQSLGELRGNPGDTIEDVTLDEVEVRATNDRLRVGEVGRLVFDGVVVNGRPVAAPTSDN
jgi:alpha-L-rhamnosidase